MTPQQLKKWRTKQGLTQREAAALFGVHERSYSDWERGVFKIPFSVVLTMGLVEKISL